MVSQAQKYRTIISDKKFDFSTLFTTGLNYILTASLIVLATVSLVAEILLHTLTPLFVMLATGCVTFVGYHQLAQSHPQLHRSLKRHLFKFRFLAMGLCGLLLVTLAANPAQAQFFGDAESWMESNFGGDTGDAIPLVFNVLRGLFLLYVGISLVRVINAARQDEDWQTIARTPLIIIIAVTAADVLTTLITG